MVAEAPFRPREELIQRQKVFQSIHKHTHLKGPMDKVTSVAIPLALAGSCLYLIPDSPLGSGDIDAPFYFDVALSTVVRVQFCNIPSGMVAEAPFRPREELIQRQKVFQSIHKHTHLKGPMDKVTSVAIPLALAGSCLYLIGRGIYNMSNGIGKKEWKSEVPE